MPRSAARQARRPQPDLSHATAPLPGRGWDGAVRPLLVIVAVLIAYHGSFTTPFIFDDAGILDTPALHTLSWQTVTGTTRPLVQLSLALNWAAGGANPFGYHVVNLIVHLIASLALYGIAAHALRTTAVPGGAALAIALVWALHPLQTQSVTYVVQRAESLMGLCYLLTLFCVVRGATTPPASLWYGAAVGACALGMLCKPVMVTAPLVVLLYDRAFLAGSFADAWRARRGLYVGLFATWVILVVLLAGQEHESAATAGFAMRDVSLVEFARSQPGVILHYLRLVVLPVGLVLDYAWPPAEGLVGVAFPTLLLGGGVAAALVAFRGEPRLAFLVIAFVLILAPSSSVVPIRDLAFEHRMYLPLAPLVALLVVGGTGLIGRAGLTGAPARRVARCATALVVVVLGGLTIARNHDYRSAVAMWMDVTEKRPANVRAYSNLSQALTEAGMFDEAVAAARAALRLDPANANAHVKLGHGLSRRGDVRDAEREFAAATRLDPAFADAHNNLGAALADQKRYAEAEPHYREALRIRPAYAAAWNNLGVAVMERGDYAQATAHYREAMTLSPTYAEPYSNLGNLLLRQGRPQEASEHYRRALTLKPQSAEIHFNLALALVAEGRRDEAAVHAAEALRIRRDLEPLVRRAGLAP